ncbi:MAG: helix-turn-helix domain-containing protein [Bacilli bacterium]|nr:helix-turn-helix domain-containing protein [Bacilli bacterium]
MKELGEYLKRTRISNGVSLTEACEDLDFSTTQLENIESGNVRAFKDVYELRDSVKSYAKYLGLDADKVVDEFNGFLFQHTSRISLEDIRAAQKKKEELLEEKRVKSPYTIEYKEKVSLMPVISIIIAIVCITLIVLIIVSNVNRHKDRTDELKYCIRLERLV